MQQKLLKRTAVCSFVFFAAAMGMILAVSAGRGEQEPQGAGWETAGEEPVQEASGPEDDARGGLIFDSGQADTSYLRIPLPEGCRAGDIVIENHYMERKLRVFVPGVREEFYAENSISGNRREILQGSLAMAEGGAVLDFQLTGVYECRTILEDEKLYIRFLPPAEVYDRIVVIDPAYGGEEPGGEAEEIAEKDINLKIALRLKERLDENGIKAYYTRVDDSDPGKEERTALGNGSGADMYIRIELGKKEDPDGYGVEAVCRPDYFIPGFGNRELAGFLEREVTEAVSGKSLGVSETLQEEETLAGLEIPAACIRPGCITNRQEALLLGREEYIDKIAEGIYNAILKGYETNSFR